VAISLVQANSSDANTSPATLPVAVTAGNTIIMPMANWPPGSTVWTTPSGFTQTVLDQAAGSNNEVDVMVAWHLDAAGGDTSWAWSATGGNTWWSVAEFNLGGPSITGVDFSTSLADLSHGSPSSTLTGSVPAAGGELVIAGWFSATSDSLTFPTPTGWNLLAKLPDGTGTGNVRGEVYWQVASTTAPSIGFTWTGATNEDYTMMMTAYLVSAGGGAAPVDTKLPCQAGRTAVMRKATR
jgi:hypothetical protein